MESDHDGRVVQIAAQDKVLIVGLVVSQLPILLLSVGAHLDPVLRVVVLRLEMDGLASVGAHNQVSGSIYDHAVPA
jgi:hypothetical protein